RDALIRGHVLKCEYCRGTSFYSLDENQRFTCFRCRRNQRATRLNWSKQRPEPKYRYALAEVIFQFLQNNGHLPLLATYERFAVARNNRAQPLDLAFEIELRSPDDRLSEHDIVASSGANLWLGEATVNPSLGTARAERRRLARLRDVA